MTRKKLTTPTGSKRSTDTMAAQIGQQRYSIPMYAAPADNFRNTLRPVEWRSSYNTSQINGLLQQSRYTDTANNPKGVDDKGTTKGRFKTEAMVCFDDKSPRTMPVFANKDVAKL